MKRKEVMIWTKPPGNYAPAVNLQGCKGFARWLIHWHDFDVRPTGVLLVPSVFFGLRKESLASRVTLKSAKPPEGSATPEPEKEEEDEFVGIFVVSGIFFSSGIPCLWRSLLHLIYVVLQRSLYYQPKQGTRGNFSRLAYILASTLIPFKIGND